jgi:hypothetical protein
MLVVIGCAPDERLPPDRTSVGLRMDGTHWVPIDGAPDLIDTTKPFDTTGFSGWSTAPLPLPTPYVCAVGTRGGRIYIFGEHDEVKTTIDLPEHEFVDQLLSAQGALIAITNSGSIRSYSFEGKQIWSSSAGANLTANAVVVNGLLIYPTASAITAITLRDGTRRWVDSMATTPVSLAAARDLESLAVALSFNQSGRNDSIVVLTPLTGARIAGYEAPVGRITSNLAIAGKDNEYLLFGTLGAGDESGRAASAVELKNWRTASPSVGWSHSLPYIILAMSANTDKALASGFRNGGGELVSGIDVFKLADTTFQWKRRFTEPLMGPPAVSEANVYFALSFETEAIVGARALFYTLKSGSGETVAERSLKASMGVLPAMPMPDEQGRFLEADRERPVVFALDRSTLKRVF